MRSKQARPSPLSLPLVPRELHERRRIIANIDEPETGDFDFGVYDKAHPIFGERETIARIKKEIRGLRGEWVRMTARGIRVDENGDEHRYKFTAVTLYRRYDDLFGPGSAYADIIHSVVSRYSEDEISTLDIDLEIIDEPENPEVFL